MTPEPAPQAEETKTTAPLFNRLFHQIANPFHHSFKTKWHSIIIQIFGHYGPFENEVTSISHCYTVNIDVYRIHIIKEEHLDPIKRRNPAKWLEFLIVAPLEMFSFSLCYLYSLATGKTQYILSSIAKTEKETILSFVGFAFVAIILFLAMCVLALVPTTVDLGVNIITGTLRRCFLAPARYIIRPAIETAKKYPKSFACIVGITASAALALTAMVLTGGLPAIIAGTQFLAFTLAAKLTTISILAVWVGSAFTKGFNTACDLINGLPPKTPLLEEQMQALNQRDQQSGYTFNIIKMNKKPTLEALEKTHKKNIPLLISYDNCWFIYGISPKGENRVAKIESYIMTRLPPTLHDNLSLKTITTHRFENGDLDVYDEINKYKGRHYQKRTGTTTEITRALQNVDIDHLNTSSIDLNNRYCRLAFWFGIESLTHPLQPSTTKATADSTVCQTWRSSPSPSA